MGVLVAVSFLCGRYSRPAKVTVTEKIDKVIDQTKDLQIAELQRQLAFKSSDKVEITTTSTWKRRDGSELTRVQVKVEDKEVSVTENIESKKSTEKDTSHEVLREEKKTVTENTRGVVVGPMVTFTTSDLAHPLYGGIVDAPLPLGFHFLSNIAVGPSVGVGWGLALGHEF